MADAGLGDSDTVYTATGGLARCEARWFTPHSRFLTFRNTSDDPFVQSGLSLRRINTGSDFSLMPRLTSAENGERGKIGFLLAFSV